MMKGINLGYTDFLDITNQNQSKTERLLSGGLECL